MRTKSFSSPIVFIKHVRVENLAMVYSRNIRVLDSINLEFKPGIYVLIGPNGAGKTTLLDVLAGIRVPSQGRVLLNETISLYSLDEQVRASIRREAIAYMLQEDIFIDYLNVLDNILLFRKFINISDETVNMLMEKLNIYNLKNKLPSELSGGEKKKVNFIRTYIKALSSSLILFDEPTSNLDWESTNIVRELIKELNNGKRIIIIATHDTKLLELSEAIIELRAGKLVKRTVNE